MPSHRALVWGNLLLWLLSCFVLLISNFVLVTFALIIGSMQSEDRAL